VGYQVLLDIIGSAVTGGLLLITLLNFNAENMENKQLFRDEITAQGNLVAVVDVIEDDFRRIGYCRKRSNIWVPVVTMAAAESIRFKTDIASGALNEGDGVVDSITYVFGPPALSTFNPHDRILYRRVNNEEPFSAAMGVTMLNFSYLSYNGDTLSRPVSYEHLKEIAGVEVTFRVESANPTATVARPDSFATAFVNWKQLRFEIKNFGRGALPAP
jgi:hypothetical protein